MSTALHDHLRAALATLPESGSLAVGFSGGPDSTALLHALAQLPGARRRNLRALHVDHGLHPDSAAWAQRCADFCASLGLSFTVARTSVDGAGGKGVEAAARRARYAAFASQLGDGEWLVLAHHRDDQVETVLLKLLRGAGPEGLGGMRTMRPLARGCVWRPLLELPREVLRNYLIEHHLQAIDDPANADPRFTRNVVRGELVPLLAGHWPHAETAILHSARLCRAAADYLARESESNLTVLRRADGSLAAGGWLQLADAIRATVLDAWLHAAGLPAPPDAPREELLRQVRTAIADRVPCVAWPGAEVRVWGEGLYANPPLAPVPERWEAAWNGSTLELPPGCGVLRADRAHGGIPAVRFEPPLTVRFRRGGERIKPAGDPHTRELRDLFQRSRMPPWWRERCPLIFANDELVAVADLWISARGQCLFALRGLTPHWLRPCVAPSV